MEGDMEPVHPGTTAPVVRYHPRLRRWHAPPRICIASFMPPGRLLWPGHRAEFQAPISRSPGLREDPSG